MDGYVGRKLRDELNERAGRSDDEVVKAVEAAWTKWCSQLVHLHSLITHFKAVWFTDICIAKFRI